MVVTAVVLAAAVGILLPDRPAAAVVAAILLAIALIAFLRRATRQHLEVVLTRARALAASDVAEAAGPSDAAWRAVIDELDRARVELSETMNDLAAERSRVLRVLEGLPPPILLFSAQGLTYANRSARQVFRLDDADGSAASPTPMQVLGVHELADAVERTRAGAGEQEIETAREGRVFFARTSQTAHEEVALVLTDLTESRRVDAIRRDFVTNASHELKTPVAGIQALADSLGLALERDPQRATRMILRIQGEASRLATLVRELLDLARVEELSEVHPTRRINLAAIVATQIERARTVMDDGQVTVRSQLDDSAVIHGSVEDVRMVVDNLISNAVRYNRPGGSVDVSVTVEGSKVLLRVSDTGIGIPESDVERVFERFYRVDKARSRAAGGTGLGLSLVRHATQRMGGEVSVTSVLGEGSTFTVVLPSAGGAVRGATAGAVL